MRKVRACDIFGECCNRFGFFQPIHAARIYNIRWYYAFFHSEISIFSQNIPGNEDIFVVFRLRSVYERTGRLQTGEARH